MKIKDKSIPFHKDALMQVQGNAHTESTQLFSKFRSGPLRREKNAKLLGAELLLLRRSILGISVTCNSDISGCGSTINKSRNDCYTCLVHLYIVAIES